MATFKGTNRSDKITGYSGNDIMYGYDGADTLDGASGHDDLYGGYGNDRLYGDIGNDWISGGYGDDLLYGEAGNDDLDGDVGHDDLYGGSGADDLYGGTGDDWLSGGAGSDYLWGEAGADVFFFSAGTSGVTNSTADVIKDWNGAYDDVDMTFKGTSSNYEEIKTNVTSVADAVDVADEFGETLHVFLYNPGTDTGYLISDLNNNGEYDTAVVLKNAGYASDFSYLHII